MLTKEEAQQLTDVIRMAYEHAGPFAMQLAEKCQKLVNRETEKDNDTLVAQLHAEVDKFVERSAPRLQDDLDCAVLKIRLAMPQGEEDGTLFLEYALDEETISAGRDGQGGTVPGRKFR